MHIRSPCFICFSPFCCCFVDQFVYPIYNAVLKGRRPVVQKEIEEGAPEEFCELMRRCYAQDKKARPNFNVIFHALQDMSDRVVAARITDKKNSSGQSQQNRTTIYLRT